MLLESSLGHDAVIGWLSVLVDSSVAAGLLGTTVARATVTSSNPIAITFRCCDKRQALRGARRDRGHICRTRSRLGGHL